MNIRAVVIASVAVVALVVVGVLISMPSAIDTSGNVSESYLKTIDERIGKLEEAVNEHSAAGSDTVAAISYVEAVVSAAKGELESSTVTAKVPDDMKTDHEALIGALDAMKNACAGLYVDNYDEDIDGETVENPNQCYDKFDSVAEAWAAIKAKVEDR